MTQNNLIEILDVVSSSLEDYDESLWGFNIESPKQGYQTATNKIWFVGWVLGKKAPVVAVEVISEGRVFERITFNQPRGDVAEIYGNVPGVESCGFATEMRFSELPVEAELIMQAVFSDGSIVPLAVVRVGRRPPRSLLIQTDLERSRTRLQQIQAELERSQSELDKTRKQEFPQSPSQLHQHQQELQQATQINFPSELAEQPLKTTDLPKPGVVTHKGTNSSMLNYTSGMSDREWLEVLITSVEHKFVNGIELPGFPPDEIQRNSVGSSGEHALRDGFNLYCEIKRYAAQLGQTLTRDSCILDFGCGWGRIIRFFLKDVAADNLYGIDVDPQMIDICLQTVGHGNYSTVNPLPPSELPDSSFDIVYAFSVFSHLAEPVHIKWVEEFSRILKPGGILVVTVWGRNFIEFCRSLRGQSHSSPWYNALANSFSDTEAALADYDSGKFLYSSTGGGDTRDASFDGEAVIPPGYVKREWTKYFAFCDFVDDPARLSQALIVMQKPVNGRLPSQLKATEAEFSPTSLYSQKNVHLNANLQPKSHNSFQQNSTAQLAIEKLIWKKDRVLLDDLVFRLEHSKDANWELGEECFILYKPKDLIDQYERFFSTHKEFQPQNVFELGMWEGGSVAFWFEILKPKKHIAIDLRASTDSKHFQKYVNSRGLNNRLKTYWDTNQADSARLKEIVKQEFDEQLLDLVIDDASHLYELTKISFETLFPLLRPGSFYIIEDWAWWHWKGLEDYYADKIPLSQLIVELVEAAGTSANLIKNIVIYQSIAIVERGDASLQELGDFKLDNYIYKHPKK